ncbi:MAG: SAM-dependent chlorinase/fluorinase [Rhodothermia bacterium]|nr:SAM-dependent chlorinase/fluorinase [Rhodothermia bacterium]
MPIITLTTDYGTRDPYVAALKGVLVSTSPNAHIHDLSHEISPQDLMEAAFFLRNAYPYFPEGSIHMVVVDPGVGTKRKAVAFRANGHFFIGPDNGIFSLMLDGVVPEELVELDRSEFWRTEQPANTFHGRDIFASVAAHLANGTDLACLGTALNALKPLYWALPIADQQGIRGWVTHIDRYGNCISNIHKSIYLQHHENRKPKCYVGSAIISGLKNTYGEVDSGDMLTLFGSHDFLEIAINEGRASDLLGIIKGTPISMVFVEQKKALTELEMVG